MVKKRRQRITLIKNLHKETRCRLKKVQRWVISVGSRHQEEIGLRQYCLLALVDSRVVLLRILTARDYPHAKYMWGWLWRSAFKIKLSYWLCILQKIASPGPTETTADDTDYHWVPTDSGVSRAGSCASSLVHVNSLKATWPDEVSPILLGVQLKWHNFLIYCTEPVSHKVNGQHYGKSNTPSSP